MEVRSWGSYFNYESYEEKGANNDLLLVKKVWKQKTYNKYDEKAPPWMIISSSIIDSKENMLSGPH